MELTLRFQAQYHMTKQITFGEIATCSVLSQFDSPDTSRIAFASSTILPMAEAVGLKNTVYLDPYCVYFHTAQSSRPLQKPPQTVIGLEAIAGVNPRYS